MSTASRTEARKERAAALYREFRCGPVRITRYEYEAMPIPMNALGLSDGKMAKLAVAIRDRMVAMGWMPADIELAYGELRGSPGKAQKVRDDLIRAMEGEALDAGMKYC